MDSAQLELFKSFFAIAVAVAALILSALSFRRSGRKDTEDKVYQLKVEACKEMIEATLIMTTQFNELISKIRQAKSSTIMLESIAGFSSKVDQQKLRLTFYKHMLILPEILMNQLFEIEQGFQDLAKLIQKYNPEMPDKAQKLNKIIQKNSDVAYKVTEFIFLAREDMLIDELQMSLFDRLKNKDPLKNIKSLFLKELIKPSTEIKQ